MTQVLELGSEAGQGLVEYALILVLVAMVVLAVLLVVGPAVGNAFSQIASELSF
ncbi:MAG: Flp family type IVb pilin [Anaerolineae bacterium]|nr:MAG: Flp family type IVb pilin [Anaerolineae bacterium]